MGCLDTVDKKFIEIMNSQTVQGQRHQAIFGFDGTRALISKGWQDIMIPLMVGIFIDLPRQGIDEWKRKRLIEAGADILITDYPQSEKLVTTYFEGDQ